jgi:hypothetical protein
MRGSFDSALRVSLTMTASGVMGADSGELAQVFWSEAVVGWVVMAFGGGV